MTDVVKAIHLTGNNSDLIESAARLGYLRHDDYVLDATYGKGTFWKKWRPEYLVANDLDPNRGPGWHYDFREFPTEWEAKYDVVVFDPDYKLQGTSSNAGPASSNASYGMDREYRPVVATGDLYSDGMRECHRVLKPQGMLLVKTMDQVVSGDKKWLTVDIINFARRAVNLDGLQMSLVDWFMLEGMRAQPSNRTRKCKVCDGGRLYNLDGTPCEGGCEFGRIKTVQQHSASNYSSLLLFRKGRS